MRMCRCNMCMKVFAEEDIILDSDDIERCPKCGEEGCLMDLDESESEDEDVLTHLLIKSGVTWNPRKIANFLISNGVSVKK